MKINQPSPKESNRDVRAEMEILKLIGVDEELAKINIECIRRKMPISKRLAKLRQDAIRLGSRRRVAEVERMSDILGK